ncbi:MAG: hypothetical protein WKG32_12100 [Gemmatimonadaceae bacterium]
MGKNKENDGKQQGAVRKAEGQHGDKTHARFQEQIHSSRAKSGGPGDDAAGDPTHADEGEHRLFEGREQHDEGEKNSEKTRLSKDIQRHHHDREQFQVPGGKENHPRA